MLVHCNYKNARNLGHFTSCHLICVMRNTRFRLHRSPSTPRRTGRCAFPRTDGRCKRLVCCCLRRPWSSGKKNWMNHGNWRKWFAELKTENEDASLPVASFVDITRNVPRIATSSSFSPWFALPRSSRTAGRRGRLKYAGIFKGALTGNIRSRLLLLLLVARSLDRSRTRPLQRAPGRSSALSRFRTGALTHSLGPSVLASLTVPTCFSLISWWIDSS